MAAPAVSASVASRATSNDSPCGGKVFTAVLLFIETDVARRPAISGVRNAAGLRQGAAAQTLGPAFAKDAVPAEKMLAAPKARAQ